jgi:hypothetical protein
MGRVILFLVELLPKSYEGFSEFIAPRLISADSPEIVTWGILNDISVASSQ